MVSCFQNRRWDSDFLTLRSLIDAGKLGPIHNYEAHFEFFKPGVGERWQEKPGPGVGVHFDLGAHLIDQALILFGQPDWVEGEAIIQRPGGLVPDSFFARLAYGSARVNLSGSYYCPDNRSRCLVQGAKAGWRKWHMDIQESQLRAGMTPHDAGFGVEPEEHFGTLTTYVDGTARLETVPSLPGTHQEYYRQVRAALETGTAPPVTAQQARNTIQVIEAIMTSGKTGTRVVPRD